MLNLDKKMTKIKNKTCKTKKKTDNRKLKNIFTFDKKRK